MAKWFINMKKQISTELPENMEFPGDRKDHEKPGSQDR